MQVGSKLHDSLHSACRACWRALLRVGDRGRTRTQRQFCFN